MGENREDAARAAIQMEKDGKSFYLDMAANTSNKAARSMFEAFAVDEQNHVNWIEKMVPEAASAGEANRALYDRLSEVFKGVSSDVAIFADMSEDDLKAIDIAIVMEEKSIEAYRNWLADTSDAGVKKLCNVLLGQERCHKQVLENTKTYLDRTADWFMQEEQWNFD